MAKPVPSKPSGYTPGARAATSVIAPSASRVRIHCETWTSLKMRMRSLGVLFEFPAEACKAFERQGLSIQEKILDSAGNRVWTISERQAPKISGTRRRRHSR